jgi:hypothetical protein
MKALSLWQPWATAIALQLKKIETRGWYTSYRGPLAIHAAKRWTVEEREFLEDMQELHFFPTGVDVPLGAIVAVVNLENCVRTEKLLSISTLEESWGNYGPERFGFMLSNIRALPEPIPFRGAQGFFYVPDHILSGGVPADAAQGKLL